MSHSKHGSVNKIDCLLAQYYIAMGRNDYFDNDCIGKFRLFCDEEGESDVINKLLNKKDEKQSDFDLDEIEDEILFDLFEPAWLDIDDQFPIPRDTTTDREEQIKKILKHFYDITENTNYMKHKLSWSN
eukprot:190939_1